MDNVPTGVPALGNLRCQRAAIAVMLLSTCLAPMTVLADAPAITADPAAAVGFILNAGRTAGWQFTVNAPLQVTQLGLYDAGADGFQIGYQVGLWNDQAALLTSAIIPSGTAAAYSDGFRYVN